MSSKVRVAALAIATIDGMMENNYARALRMAEISLKHQPDLILLPECFAAGFCADELAPYAEGPNSPYQIAFRQFSEKTGCIIVLGYVAKVDGQLRNSIIVYDRGEIIGRQDKIRFTPLEITGEPARDEMRLFVPGQKIEIFHSHVGRFAVFICFDGTHGDHWAEAVPQVDFILCSWNCDNDPAHHPIQKSRRLGVPTAWADRTGLVYSRDDYLPNLGSAGLVDATGHVIARSAPGVEQIVVGDLTW